MLEDDGTEIRIRGGGASQLSIASGNPEASVSQVDFGIYAQDDWRVRPNLTFSYGLRYERQTNIKSILNFAPVVLNVPEGVDVRKVDLSIELQILAFHAQRRNAERFGQAADQAAAEA